MPLDYAQMQEDALRILDLLCRQPSVSAETRALDETAELVEELLTGVGFETQHVIRRYNEAGVRLCDVPVTLRVREPAPRLPVVEGNVVLVPGSLTVVELHARSQAMCHNCATRTMKLIPVPKTIEDLRAELDRERRQDDRRIGADDRRFFKRERRVGDRRSPDRDGIIWLSDEYILEIIDDEPAEPHASDLTMIRPAPEAPPSESA